MLNSHKRKSAGFTLIELAIVLGIAGILFGGLWRLLSTSNTQMRDQATATHHQQIVNAVASYLQSSDGQNYLNTIDITAGAATAELKLPQLKVNAAGSAGCTGDTNMSGQTELCSFLPPGTWSGTTNPYGQTYQIQVLRSTTDTYSFMVLTTGGDAIPDTSGGRISAMIGGDGGFIYSSDVCGAPVTNRACGSFGGWSSDLADFGWAALAAPGRSGYIASRTYNGGSLALGSWLARKVIPGDTGTPPEYNTMKTNLFLGGDEDGNGTGNNFYFGRDTSSTSATGGGSTMFVQGGRIDLGDGHDLDGTIVGSLAAGQAPFITLSTVAGANAPIILNGCKATAGCTDSIVLQINHGDIVVQNGIITSPTFTYSSSDARLKKDIKPLSDALVDVLKIKPVSFAYKADGKRSMGVIAQDLEKIYPQLVLTGHDGMKTVGYEGLIAPLIGSVQELKKENDALKASLEEQKVRQQNLEKEIERLRNR